MTQNYEKQINIHRFAPTLNSLISNTTFLFDTR